MTTSRTWLLIFEHAEIERRYQWPVGVERVLADHRAALAALPISEGMHTSATPIEAPAADTQAGEGHACIAGPQKEAWHTGSLDRDDALAADRARGVHHRANRPGGRPSIAGPQARGAQHGEF